MEMGTRAEPPAEGSTGPLGRCPLPILRALDGLGSPPQRRLEGCLGSRQPDQNPLTSRIGDDDKHTWPQRKAARHPGGPATHTEATVVPCWTQNRLPETKGKEGPSVTLMATDQRGDYTKVKPERRRKQGPWVKHGASSPLSPSPEHLTSSLIPATAPF